MWNPMARDYTLLERLITASIKIITLYTTNFHPTNKKSERSEVKFLIAINYLINLINLIVL